MAAWRIVFVEHLLSIATCSAEVAVSWKSRDPIQVTAEIEFYATKSRDARSFGQDDFAVTKIVTVFGFDICQTLLIETP